MRKQTGILFKIGTVENLYMADTKGMWDKWNDVQRYVFNETYEYLCDNQNVLLHPKAKTATAAMWNTTAWNAAVIAADSLKTLKSVRV
ncbi:hypothetical protein [Flavobacterium sp.]|jgi:hypothetical protein|uniref:hypothetical protein n=1 Tax=Flavobacterium sp. TaxID=239 RepID=UPI0037C117DC